MKGKNKKKKEEEEVVEEEEERMKFFCPILMGKKIHLPLWEFRVKCNYSIIYRIFGHLQICLSSSFVHLAKLYMLSLNFSLEIMSY